ncbi:hypothetical protein HYU10_04915 [Candidatus Woesearchaeota archaeon]|nr:hypothetical protein [Candidatus Woesearchaeota archaeon]
MSADKEMPKYSADELKEFQQLCTDRTPDNWMNMKPMMNGKITEGDSCWGCMSDDGMSHFCGMGEYKEYLSLISD